MPDQPNPDELDDYLQGGSDVSSQYHREASPAPPHALDRLVLGAAGSLNPRSPIKSQKLAPLAFAASVLLSLALVLAIVLAPQAKRQDSQPQVLRVRMFKSEPPRAALASPRERNPALWLADINALRRAGRNAEADVEMRRFHSAYPDYIIPINE
jgi:hypothetical protein